jgi:hypothetical protein
LTDKVGVLDDLYDEILGNVVLIHTDVGPWLDEGSLEATKPAVNLAQAK